MARLVGQSRQGVEKWARVPPDFVLAIELATGGRVRAHAMAPRIYPRWLKTWPRPHKATAGGVVEISGAPISETPATPLKTELERLDTVKAAARKAGLAA
jgi:Putative antitoxin of bacterial toxin-antitoxin system, YdaS/YdaT